MMSQYKEPEMSFNYSINNKSRINEIDEKIIKMDIGDENVSINKTNLHRMNSKFNKK